MSLGASRDLAARLVASRDEILVRIAPIISSGGRVVLLVLRSFFKDEEWVDYLSHVIDMSQIEDDFAKVVGKFFKVLLVGSTSSLGLYALVDAGGKDIEETLDALESELISLFLSDAYLGKIQRQVDIFRSPFKSFMEFSVGFALVRSANIDDLAVAASVALSRADIRNRRRLDDLSLELFAILDRGELYSYFQPVVDVKTGTIYAHEALIRGPVGSPLRNPEVLFRVAHYSRVEMDLDRLARRRHLESFAEYRSRHPDARLAINLGPFTPMFLEDVSMDMEHVGMPKENVIWEVSERTYIDDFVAFARVVDFLVSEGYRVAIDDFGAGATTFKLIFSIDAHIIKIDRSFVEGVQNSPAKQMFLERLISCFWGEDSLIFVEGVEHGDEVDVLLRIGYRYYQGFYFFRPRPRPVEPEEAKRILSGIDYDIRHMKFSGCFTRD